MHTTAGNRVLAGPALGCRQVSVKARSVSKASPVRRVVSVRAEAEESTAEKTRGAEESIGMGGASPQHRATRGGVWGRWLGASPGCHYFVQLCPPSREGARGAAPTARCMPELSTESGLTRNVTRVSAPAARWLLHNSGMMEDIMKSAAGGSAVPGWVPAVPELEAALKLLASDSVVISDKLLVEKYGEALFAATGFTKRAELINGRLAVRILACLIFICCFQALRFHYIVCVF